MISLPIFAGLLKFISVYINESLAEFVHKWNESVKHKIKIDLRSIKVRFGWSEWFFTSTISDNIFCFGNPDLCYSTFLYVYRKVFILLIMRNMKNACKSIKVIEGWSYLDSVYFSVMPRLWNKLKIIKSQKGEDFPLVVD